MRSLLLFLMTSLFLVCPLGWAADVLPLRAVSLEWEGNPDAQSYDVEIQRRDEHGNLLGQPKNYATTEALYSGRLEPGYYLMRVRGKDHRKVPGEWSDPMELTVQLETVKMIVPSKLHLLQSQNPSEEKFLFKWQAVPGALKYLLNIESDDKAFQKSFEVSETEKEIQVPVGQRLIWSVKGIGDSGLQSEAEAQGVMEVWGPALELPKIAKPESRFVREIAWQGSKLDRSYSVRLDRWDEKNKKWVEALPNKSQNEAKFEFPPNAPGGRYRAIVKAEAPLRKPSKLAVMQFPVVHGDRSPAAEYRATLRESIERTKGWFFIASYLISSVGYTGHNYDNQSAGGIGANFKGSLGGTGRLGAGFLPEKALWGFLGVIDLSGFVIANQNPTYASAELNAVRRSESGQIGEIRQQMGAFYKEAPEILPANLNQFNIGTIASLGLHYGVEYWWALTPKFGFQVNGHLYPNLGSARTPNGNSVTPSLSYQLGLLGSYRLWTNATGLMGYAYRDDSFKYRSNNGDRNTVEISGHYLNFFLEWSL